jgi:hypothetical protein
LDNCPDELDEFKAACVAAKQMRLLYVETSLDVFDLTLKVLPWKKLEEQGAPYIW